MSTVYNVSDLTNILSGTIQRNVSVQGEVEILTDGRSNAFYLINESNKLRCFIPQGVMTPTLEQGQVVVVDGKITLFSSFSQYQITVSDIQVNGGNTNTFSVTGITNEISRLVAGTPELQNIRIQGTVFWAAVSNWDLIDVDSPPLQRIRCVSPGPIPPVQIGNDVRVEGGVSVYPPKSEYQINVVDIAEDNTPTCQCPGCDRCSNTPQCDRLREVPNLESCATCLPRPPDELYKLCPNCYHESPDREDRVIQAVCKYFDVLGVNEFSPDTEWQIQFGTRNGIADVVLSDSRGSLAVIAECKGAGYVGHGIEQLKSYLSATATNFGIFANRADLSQWKFYENRRRNQFDQIDRSEFEVGVVKGIHLRKQLQDEIKRLRDKILELKNLRCELEIAVNQITQTKHTLTERTSNLTEETKALENYKSELHAEIHRKLDNLFEEKMQRLERPLSDLKIELQKQGIVNWFKNLFSKESE